MTQKRKTKPQHSTVALRDIVLQSSVSAIDGATPAERQSLIHDILSEHDITLPFAGKAFLGDVTLHLTIGDEEWRTRLSADDAVLAEGAFAMLPLKQLLRDYLKICDSYAQSLREGGCARVEAIDMGRRGLHNEAAEMLAEKLAPVMAVDHETARRLFALLAAIHRKN